LTTFLPHQCLLDVVHAGGKTFRSLIFPDYSLSNN